MASRVGAVGIGPLLWYLITFKLMWDADSLLADEARTAYSNRLRQIEVSGGFADRWPSFFILSFDKFFGEKIISAARFKRSVAVSTTVVGMVTIAWGGTSPELFKAAYERVGRDWASMYSAVIVAAWFFNLLPDFISAVETRYLMGRIANYRSRAAATVIIVLDLIFTTLIFVLTYHAVIHFLPIALDISKNLRKYWELFEYYNYWESLSWMFRNAPTMSVDTPGQLTIGIFFYSTFFASIWLWVFVLAHFSMLAIRPLTRLVGGLKWIDSTIYPLRAIGFVAGGIACFGYWIFAAIVAL